MGDRQIHPDVAILRLRPRNLRDVVRHRHPVRVEARNRRGERPRRWGRRALRGGHAASAHVHPFRVAVGSGDRSGIGWVPVEVGSAYPSGSVVDGRPHLASGLPHPWAVWEVRRSVLSYQPSRRQRRARPVRPARQEWAVRPDATAPKSASAGGAQARPRSETAESPGALDGAECRARARLPDGFEQPGARVAGLRSASRCRLAWAWVPRVRLSVELRLAPLASRWPSGLEPALPVVPRARDLPAPPCGGRGQLGRPRSTRSGS
jgi:hypothetical protein